MDSIVLEEPPSSTACSKGGDGGGRAIDRHNPIIRDEKRLGQGCIFPSSSTNITDQSHMSHLCNQRLEVGLDQSHLCKHNPEVRLRGGDMKKKSVVFAQDDEFTKASDFTSPTSSSRCLLSEIAMSSFSSNFHHVPSSSSSPLPPPPRREHLMFHNEKVFKKIDDDLLSSPPPPTPEPPPSPPPALPCDDLKPTPSLPPALPCEDLKPPPSSPPLPCDNLKPPQSPHHEPPPPPSSSQVVVLEVALHCRGCERKMKKHISKIEGVKSFKIEFAAKRVTVVGDVTPLGVLTSVLKVKNAKLLTPATISSSSSSAQIGSNGS